MDENVKTPCIVRISAMQIQKMIRIEDFS